MQVVFLTEGFDLDALSSAFGYCKLNQDAYIYIPYSYSTTASRALKEFKHLLEPYVITKVPPNLEKAVFVDTSSLQKIRQVLDEVGLSLDGLNVEVYDHHIKRKKSLKGVKTHFFPFGACTTYFVKKLKEKGGKLSRDEATLLALGILEDTGSFNYAGTTVDDVKAYEFLVDTGLNFLKLQKVLRKTLTKQLLSVLIDVENNLMVKKINSLRVGVSFVYADKYIADVSSYLNLLEDLASLDGFFIVLITPKKKFVIGRSKNSKLDVGEILKIFGGGGHPRAASALVKDLTLEEILEKLEETLLLNTANKTVKDVMLKDFCLLKSDTNLEQIDKLSEPFCIAVDNNGKFLGVVNSQTIQKAKKHNLGYLKIEDIANSDIITLSPNMLLSTAKHFVKEHPQQELFPVIKDGKPVGVITKHSLLSTLYQNELKDKAFIFQSRMRFEPKKLNFEKRVERYFDSFTLETLKELGGVAEKLNMRAYLVGGIVRDIIMGRKNLDIDIIVEGDATKLAKQFAREKEYKFHTFDEFLTATVRVSDNLKLDLATARKETYDYPGAYPKVEKASIREDLYRRDFTINTLAIDITGENFGTLLDFFNGYKDIKDKVIRVLHELSFIEDPIRILRAVRFTGRFDFKLGKTTEKLLKFAVDNGFLSYAPAGRINLELNLTFKEEKVLTILSLMQSYNILKELFPEAIFNEEKLGFISRIHNNYNMFFEMFLKRDISRPTLYLSGLLYELPLEIAYKYLEKYHFKEVFPVLQEFHEAKEKVKKASRPSNLYELIKGIKPETFILLISYFTDEKEKQLIHIYQTMNQKGKIISGKMLKDLGLKPSPQFSVIIEDVFKRYLDKQLKNEDEIREYIKEKYMG